MKEDLFSPTLDQLPPDFGLHRKIYEKKEKEKEIVKKTLNMIMTH